MFVLPPVIFIYRGGFFLCTNGLFLWESFKRKTSFLCEVLLTLVKVRDLLYKNPFNVFFRVSVKIDKSGSKIHFKLKSASYTLENQLHKIKF